MYVGMIHAFGDCKHLLFVNLARLTRCGHLLSSCIALKAQFLQNTSECLSSEERERVVQMCAYDDKFIRVGLATFACNLDLGMHSTELTSCISNWP
jgi:hypothetical protein